MAEQTTSTLDTGSIVRTTAGADRGRVGIVVDSAPTGIDEMSYGVVTAGIGMDWYSPDELGDAGELTASDREDLDDIHAQGADDIPAEQLAQIREREAESAECLRRR